MKWKIKVQRFYKVFLGMVFAIALVAPIFVYAHPGNTASDGCHYCRTNCDKWGVPWNERHCHGGGSSPAGVQSKSKESSTWPYWVAGIALIYGSFWWFGRKK